MLPVALELIPISLEAPGVSTPSAAGSSEQGTFYFLFFGYLFRTL